MSRSRCISVSKTTGYCPPNSAGDQPRFVHIETRAFPKRRVQRARTSLSLSVRIENRRYAYASGPAQSNSIQTNHRTLVACIMGFGWKTRTVDCTAVSLLRARVLIYITRSTQLLLLPVYRISRVRVRRFCTNANVLSMIYRRFSRKKKNRDIISTFSVLSRTRNRDKLNVISNSLRYVHVQQEYTS